MRQRLNSFIRKHFEHRKSAKIFKLIYYVESWRLNMIDCEKWVRGGANTYMSVR